MKITIVVDTDDERGIRDSYKIVNHFYKKIDNRPYAGRSLSFGKIALIKMLRAFAKAVKTAEQEGEDSCSLRFNKEYAERLFDEQSL